MKKFLSILMFLTLFLSSNLVSSQNFVWAKTAGGFNGDEGRVVCNDPSGNVIVAGNFYAPSIQIGTITLNSAGLGDVYIAKFDALGNALWAQSIGGTGTDLIYGGGVCTGTNGNIYVYGAYNSTVLSMQSFTLPQAGNFDIFMAAYNSVGTLLWGKKYGTAANETAGSIAYSNSLSTLFITGQYTGSTLAIGAFSLTNTAAGSSDVFAAMFNTVGTPSWAVTAGSSNANDIGNTVSTDAAGNVYVGGVFSPFVGNNSFIGAAVTSVGGQDAFIAKYNSSGIFQWVRTGGSNGFDGANGIAIDGANNCYLAGSFNGASFVVGTSTLTNAGGSDAFLFKYNSSGTFQWAEKVSGPNSDVAYAVTVDGNNNVYLAGSFAGTVVPVGALTLTNSTPGTSTDIFTIKYNPAGTALWATSAMGASTEHAFGISSDQAGNIYVSGVYNSAAPVSFGSTTLTSAGTNDAFVAKIACLTASISGVSSVCAGTSATLYANGAANYTWSNGATTSSIVVTPTANVTYSIIGNTGACTAANSTPFSVTLLQASVNAGLDFSLTCNSTGLMNAQCTPSNPTGVQWSPATGLSSSSILTPTVTAPNTPISYALTCTLTNGCVATDTVVVSPSVPKPDICIVTTDSLNQNNEIFWDKLLYPMLDSMIIYREVSTNTYKRIGAVSKDSISYFQDTVRSVGPANGDPNISTYRYKIQVRDLCGNYGAMSLWHNTVYFSHTGSTFFWVNNYLIEGPTNPVITYSLMVCPNPTVNNTYTLVGTTAGNQNQLNDPNYSNYSATADWRVEAYLGYICYAQKIVQQGKSTQVTRSNISNNKTAPPDIGVKENSFGKSIKIYPNPAQKYVTIDLNSPQEEAELKVYDALGKCVLLEPVKGKTTVDVSGLSRGIYTLRLNGNTIKLVLN